MFYACRFEHEVITSGSAMTALTSRVLYKGLSAVEIRSARENCCIEASAELNYKLRILEGESLLILNDN